MAKMVAKSADRTLGLLIAKCKVSGGRPYDALLQPVIDYGAGIWGSKGISCINSVQHRAYCFLLGVGKYNPNVDS